MKSAFELAMERLDEQDPQAKLSDDQKQRIAEIDDKFKARIAEREVFLGDLIAKAQAAGNFAELPELEQQLARELKKHRDDGEAAKEKVRNE